MIRRPREGALAGLPWGARSAGYHDAPRGFAEKLLRDFFEVIWCVSGEGTVIVDERQLTLNGGDAIVLFPGCYHQYRVDSDLFEYRWWTIDGPLALSAVTSFGLVAGRVYAVGAPSAELFARLEQSIHDITPAGERLASAVCYELLIDLVNRISFPAKEEPVEEMLRIIDQRWSDPTLGIDELSRQMPWSRTTLSRRFKQQVGLAPVEYLTQLRVQNAMCMLRLSEKPVADVARECGYGDPSYFARLIKRVTGLTPKQLREG